MGKPSVADDILRAMAAATDSGPVQFLKAGQTTLKLLLPPEAEGDQTKFFAAYTGTYRKPGQLVNHQQHILFPALILAADDTDVPISNTNVKFIRMPLMSAKTELVGLIKAKRKLFEPKGKIIIIDQYKDQGGFIKYKASGVDEEFDASDVIWPDITIVQAAAEQARMSEEKAAGVVAKANKAPDGEDLL